MILSDYTADVELYQWSMISQSLWVTFPNARFARLEQFLSHSTAFRDIALMAPSDYAASPLYHRGVFCRSYCERSKSSSYSGARLASWASLSLTRTNFNYDHLSVLPTTFASDHCRYDPRGSDHAHLASSEVCSRPTSPCSRLFSPRNLRLGSIGRWVARPATPPSHVVSGAGCVEWSGAS
jgi:hypothetical protein